jgi:DNA-binding GntR family transcriptional regulator
VDAILAGRPRPFIPLGEQALGTVFDVSLTIVRGALIRPETRGLVDISPRRRRYFVEPALDDVLAAFQARRAIETGIVKIAGAHRDPAGAHRARAGCDPGQRPRGARRPAGEFSCVPGRMSNRIPSDPAARTIQIAALCRTAKDATAACDDREQIAGLLAAGEPERAARDAYRHRRRGTEQANRTGSSD